MCERELKMLTIGRYSANILSMNLCFIRKYLADRVATYLGLESV